MTMKDLWSLSAVRQCTKACLRTAFRRIQPGQDSGLLFKGGCFFSARQRVKYSVL